MTVANNYTVFMNYKRFHWNVFGPLFRDVHLPFDEHAAAVLETMDELGERVRILSGEATGTPKEVSELATVKMARNKMSVREMIEQAGSNHRLVIGELKIAIRSAESENYPGTAASSSGPSSCMRSSGGF